MSQKTNFKPVLLKLAEALIACFAIWFVGWLLYDVVELWLYFTSIKFQHLLLTVITIVLLVACELARKTIRIPTMHHETEASQDSAVLDTGVVLPQSKPAKEKTKVSRSRKSLKNSEALQGCMKQNGDGELDTLKQEISEIKGKLADIHAFDQVKKKRAKHA